MRASVMRLFPRQMPSFTRSGLRPALAVAIAAAMVVPLLTAPAAARGPENISDVAEQVIDAVVNISTKQSVDISKGTMPQLPPGSPFEDFFEEFFKNRRGRSRRTGRHAVAAPRQFARLRLHHR